MLLIEALWHDLNGQLTAAERAAVEAKRVSVARKRATYKALEAECAGQLTRAVPIFEQCYASHGLPSQNPSSRAPFFGLRISQSGQVREITFFEGASAELKPCLAKTLNGFNFSPFDDDESVTLYSIDYPAFCRVAERDALHD